MHTIISENLDTIVQIFEKYNVSRLYVFGSVVTERFSDKSSDVDLLVELEPMPFIERGEKLLQFWDEVETLFQRKVDLLTDQPIKNQYFKAQVEKTKKLIYDRAEHKIPV
jgi:uncharacterized protein